MENDVNNADQVVTDNADANTEQPVIALDVNTDVVDQSEADKAAQDQTVPYDRFKEVNDAKKAAEEQAAYSQRQLELYQQTAVQQQPVQQQAPKSTSQQALDNLGITADELFGENVVRYQETVSQIENNKRQQGNAAMETQQFMMTHADLSSVVGSVNPTTGQIMQPTPELMELVRKKPYLAQASVSGLYAAVQDERRFNEYEKTASIQKEHQVRTGVDVATKPLGGSAASGGGSGSQGSQKLYNRDQTLQIKRDIAAGKYS